MNFLVLLSLFVLSRFCNKSSCMLPNNLVIGVATSAYQIEGAWNEDGKGESILDNFFHNHPDKISDPNNADIAADAYHRVKEDVALIKEMGFQTYRFSISWSRVLPTGFEHHINPLGIAYYNNLIDELIAEGIEPVVTMYHFDLPQPLQNLGGWANPYCIRWFKIMPKFYLKTLEVVVKTWVTINEPKQMCRYSYGKALLAPAILSEGLGEYLCGHYSILAHAEVYHLYLRKYKAHQKGEVGIAFDCNWAEEIPRSDNDAANRKIAFDIDMYANPIFGQFGDYPELVKKIIERKSIQQGYKESRLPKFSPEEIAYVKGASDFFGVNYYFTAAVKTGPSNLFNTNDMDIDELYIPSWSSDFKNIIKLYALGFRKVLRYVKVKYGNPKIIVCENGISTPEEGLNDLSRITYYKTHLKSVVDAINMDGLNIRKYFAWSFLDSFEWTGGYTEKYGLIYVNFTDPNRQRVPKASVKFFKSLMGTRVLQIN